MPQYQGVWTLEQQAQAQSNQQWVTDPNFKNTTLLLQADGTGSGSQNQTFLDGSTNNFFITRNGNTTQGSFSPFSQAPGYWGNYFDGSSYLSIANNANLNLGSSNFTIEFWVYAPSSTSPNAIISKGTTSSLGSDAWSVEWINTTGTLGYGCGAFNGWASPIVTGTVTLNAWNHVAVVRNGTTHTLYVNGISASTATASYTVTSAGSLYIGTGWYAPSSRYFVGYVSNARLVIGTAVYTSNFAPSTTPLTAITNTQLLTCQNNRFIDNSANAFAFTVTGTPSVQAFGPFAPALQWTPDVVGGSGYFDGTGDYLNTPTSSNFVTSGDFTMEAWAYNTGRTNNYQGIIVQRSASGGPGINTTNTGVIEYVFGGTVMATVTMPVNQWFHVAMSRSGSGSNNISMYFNGTRIAQATNTGSTVTNNIAVGRYYTDVDNYYWLGYIASTRYTTSAIYSGATITVPTAPLTAVANTQLLLNYTNAGIYDGKMANNLETVGNAQVATSPVKYGSGSMYFNGSTSYLRSQVTSPLFAIGTTYTIEGWFYRLSNTSSGTYTSAIELIGTQPFGTTTTGFLLTFGTSGSLYFYDGANTAAITYANATTLIPLNQWNHIAVVRNGSGSNNVTLFVNGISVATGTSSSAQSTAQSYFIGGDTNGNGCFTGYMDDVRVTVGVARYIANFTPPQQALPRQ